MTNDLKIRLTLQGTEEAKAGINAVKKELDGVSNSVSQTGSAAKKMASDVDSSFKITKNIPRETTAAIDGTAQAVKKLADEYNNTGGKNVQLLQGIKALGVEATWLAIGPWALLAASTGTLVAAFIDGQREVEGFSRAIALSGNYAGMTVGSIHAMADEVAASTNITIGGAKDIASAMVSTGRIGRDAIRPVTMAIAEYAQVAGISAADAEKAMGKMFIDPLRGARELNDTFHFLTTSNMDYIQALVQSGNESLASAFLADKLTDRLKSQEVQVSWLTEKYNKLKAAMSQGWDKLIDPSLETKLASVEAKINKLKGGDNNKLFGWNGAVHQQAVNELLKERDILVAKIAAAARKADADAIASAKIEESNSLRVLVNGALKLTQVEAYKKNIDRLNAAIKAGGLDAATLDKYRAAITVWQKQIDRLSKLGHAVRRVTYAVKEHDGALQSLLKRTEDFALSQKEQIATGQKVTEADKQIRDLLEMLTQSKTKLSAETKKTIQDRAIEIALNQQLAQAIKDSTAASKAEYDVLAKQFDEDAKHLDQLREGTAKEKDAADQQDAKIKLIQQGITASGGVHIAMLQEQLDLENAGRKRKEYITEIEQQISAAKRLAVGQEWEKQYKEQVDSAASMWKSIDSTAQRTFTNIFQGGQSAFTKLRDTLKSTLLDLLYQMSIKKWIINLGASVSGTGVASAAFGQGGVMGAADGASTAMGGINAVMNTGSMMSNIGSWTANAALGSGLLNVGAGAGVSTATALGAGGASMFGGAAAASTLGTIASYALPIIGVVAALSTLFGSHGGPKSGGGYIADYTPTGSSLADYEKTAYGTTISNTGQGWITDTKDNSSMKAITDSLYASYSQLATTIGQKVGTVQFGIGANTDPEGTAGNMYYGKAVVDGKTVYDVATDDSGSRGDSAAQEWLKKSSADMLKSAIVPAFREVSDSLGTIAQSITGDIAAITSQLQGLADVANYIKSNPLESAIEQINIAGRSAYQIWRAAGDTLKTAISGFNGSANSIAAIGDATKARYQQELSLIGQIQGAMISASAMFGSSITSIKMSTMDDPTKYDFLRSQADQKYNELQSAIDPAAINNLATQINEITNQAYGLLSSDQQKATSQSFIDYLSKVNDTTQAQLKSSQDQVVSEHQQFTADMKGVMDTAAKSIVDAGSAMMTAANTPIKVTSDITVHVIGGQGAANEVGLNNFS